MIVTYFNYLWDTDGVSAGSAIKGREFVEAIRRQGHTVHLEWRTPQPTGNANVQRGIREGLKPHLQRYLREPNRYLCNVKHLNQEYRILKRQRPDIFFPRLEYGNFSSLLLSKWLKIPTVVEADCPPTHEWIEFYAKDALKFGNLSLKLELALLNHADAVITQSNQLLDYYCSLGVAREKMYMIPNGADLNKFSVLPKDKRIADKFNLHDKVVIGWLGAGNSWTGIEAITASARNLLKNNPQVCFLMLGTSDNMDYFRHNLCVNGHSDRVNLPGFVPHSEIPKYLSCMDIVLAPYPKLDFFYASSMKLFEYMASGKAILATRIGQIAEVIDEGRNGLLFDPESPTELSEKLHALISSSELRKKLGTNARIDSERKWNWDEVGKQMCEIFEKILKQRESQN